MNIDISHDAAPSDSDGGMHRDIRDTAVFHEAERIFEEVCKPGEGFVSDIADIQLSVDASRLLFTGTLVEELNKPGATRICEFELETGSSETLTFGPNSDRHARSSPDETTIAFLSDRGRATDFQLFFLDAQSHTVTAAPNVDGWIEYFEWSPDGLRILLGVARHGADLSSGQGAYKTGEVRDGEPSWMPQIIGASSDSLGRKAWILELGSGKISCASRETGNVWEARWCGKDRLAVVKSGTPEEGSWYNAELAIIDLSTGVAASLYKPVYQIAFPQTSASGKHLAFIESVASDRGFVAGELRLYDLHDRTCRLLETDNVDVTYLEWRSDDLILAAGHRGLETVIVLVDAIQGTCKELWQSSRLTTSGDYATVLGLHKPEDFAFICESFLEKRQIATVKGGSFDVANSSISLPELSDSYHESEAIRWQAPDGLQIEGWLLRPKSNPPHAMILYVHDGPVFHWRPHWLGRTVVELMLLRRGYAIFLPNPRGSSGRGQAFAARVIGDIGGADTGDFLSGVDYLVDSGVADPSCLGVMGLSYGGLMTCWLTTQDTRFKAAISVGPATNHVSHHLSCNIPQFVSLFLQDHYTNLAGAYYSRSPILQAHRSKTPTLLVCGALDRCTPAEEAVQFHNALLENGIESIVVRYPEEGHGVRGMPASIDFAARCVMWFENHIGRAATMRSG